MFVSSFKHPSKNEFIKPATRLGNVHQLTHQVAVDALAKIIQVEVYVFYFIVEFASVIIAQPFGV